MRTSSGLPFLAHLRRRADLARPHHRVPRCRNRARPIPRAHRRGTRAPAPRLRKIYIWLFRGAPTLLQLLFVWNALPQLLPVFRQHWFTPFLAAWVALSLNEAAYQAEISRAALASVPREQRDAGFALGLSRAQCFRLVLLPQAIRVAIPPTANEFITLLKVTSLASVISLQELLAVTTREISVTFRFTELYTVALIYYLAIVSALMVGQSRLEHHFGAGQATTRHTHG